MDLSFSGSVAAVVAISYHLMRTLIDASHDYRIIFQPAIYILNLHIAT